MRFTGKLTTWHDDRGFGFITPDEGGQEIFVHISELPWGRRPAVGQAYGFEVALNRDGKKKAVGLFVHREPARSSPATSSRGSRAEPRVGFFETVVGLIVLCGIGFGVYSFLMPRSGFVPKPSASTLFKCDGRKYCSQMTSCKEAKFFLNNCSGTQMDGDNDGIPCEQDLCSGLRDGLFR